MMKTKIICTLGPSSSSERIVSELARAGMNIARLNFSHGTHNERTEKVKTVRRVAEKLKKHIELMADLQGSKIRIGNFKTKNNSVELKKGSEFIITTESVLGDSKKVSTDYKELHKVVRKKDNIFLDDGKIDLVVQKVKGRNIFCDIIVGGELSGRKGLIVSGRKVNLPGVTEQDIEDIKKSVALGFDYIAQSFVRKKEHILKIKKILKEMGAPRIKVIAKIEDKEGVENIDSIISVSDGIMVARGDMGICLPRETVPFIQKQIIKKCNSAGKLDIVATQMLDSMISNPFPTRAEVTDVVGAVLEGADALLLSGETSVGKYPVEAVKEMKKIVDYAEKQKCEASPFI